MELVSNQELLLFSFISFPQQLCEEGDLFSHPKDQEHCSRSTEHKKQKQDWSFSSRFTDHFRPFSFLPLLGNDVCGSLSRESAPQVSIPFGGGVLGITPPAAVAACAQGCWKGRGSDNTVFPQPARRRRESPPCQALHQSFSTWLSPGNGGSEHHVIKARGASEGKKAAHYRVKRRARWE